MNPPQLDRLLADLDALSAEDQQLDVAPHVQTLVIPVMSEPSAEPEKPTGVLSRLRKKKKPSGLRR